MTCSRCLSPHPTCRRMRTQLNIGTGANGSFSIFAVKADGHELYPPFDPYDNNLFFLLGAFIFEDVGVTAYQERMPWSH